MIIARLTRIPKRINDDLKIIQLAENWREILLAKISQKPLTSVRLRCGVSLNSPEEVNPNFLFHEIWIDEFYSPKGYEISDGQTVIDVGANIGVFALWAATKGKDVKVRSFEPFPMNAKYFRLNQKASKLHNIELIEMAVGCDNGKRLLKVSDSWMLHSLIEPQSKVSGIEIDCISLDTALRDLESCSLLKLDCEGSEYEILYSAGIKTLDKIQRIVCEFNIQDHKERNGLALANYLEGAGFHIDHLTQLDNSTGFLCARK